MIVEAFAAIAQATRLDALRLLLDRREAGVPAGDVAKLLDVPQNTMSAHLAVLKRAGLVRTERHGTTIIYRPDTERVWQLVDFLVTDFAALAAAADKSTSAAVIPRAEVALARPYNVLFLCTGNSVRSILAEAILNRDGDGRFCAFSAGNKPRGEIHPTVISTLEGLDYPIEGLRSKSWDEFASPEAPVMDFVFTLCDSAAGEECPVWPGRPLTAHWGIEDPSIVGQADFQQVAAFRQAAGYIRTRVSAFISLPLGSLDRMSVRDKLRTIGSL